MLRGLPCLGSFSAVQLIRHMEQPPTWGPTLHQALKGAPWMGSYSVVQRLRHLVGQPLYCSAADVACGEREAIVMSPHPTVTQQYHLACTAACLSSTGIFYHHLVPHIPSIRLSAVNSSPRPGIAPHSLNSSSQPLPLPGNPCSCPAYVWLR